MTTARPSPWWLLPLVAALGCTGRADSAKKTSRSTLPPPAVDSDLPGRYLLVIGKGADLKQPSARWCYLDIQAEGTKLLVDAWRPDEMEVKVTRALLKHDGQVSLSLTRSWVKGKGDQETEINESWELKGFLRPLPRARKRPAKKTGEEGEEDAEPEEEPERGLAGKARVTIAGSPRPYTFSYTARPVPEDEEQPWKEAPTGRPKAEPSMADLERAFKAGTLDFEKVPPKMQDALRRKLGS